MEVTGAATTSYNVLSNVTYSPNHRQDGAPSFNIQSPLRTAPDVCKNVSLAVLFGSNGNSHAVFTQSDIIHKFGDAGLATVGGGGSGELGQPECRVPQVHQS